jgi:hypothetical protein
VLSKFEEFISRKSVRKYSLESHKVRILWHEVCGSNKSISKVLSEEILREEKLRSDIFATLGKDIENNKELAENWSALLKGRTIIMDSWVSLHSSIIALLAIGSTLFALLALAFSQERPFGIMIGLGIFVIVLAVIKWEIEQRSSWYKQLVVHLDYIAKHGKLLTNKDKSREAATYPIVERAR